MELSEMLLGELTVEQYIVLIATFCGVLFGLIFIAVCLFGLIKKIFAFIEYFFRKDKYKSRDITFTRACKHIASLRRQFKSARTDTEYIIFLNRLSAAFMAYVEIGLIPFDYFDKVFRVSSLYNKDFEKEYARHARARANCAADETSASKESEEK